LKRVLSNKGTEKSTPTHHGRRGMAKMQDSIRTRYIHRR